MKQSKLFKIYPIAILWCLMLVSLTAFSQKEEKPKYAPGKEKGRNKTDEIGRKQGKWLFYNTFGEKISEIDFVNDQKEGVERKFFSYDKVKEETEYLAGVKEGQYSKYFFSGQVSQEGNYKDGKKDGKWTRYFEDGSIRQEGAYKVGKKDGVWKSYNRKGTVVAQATYKEGIDVDVLDAQKKKADDDKKSADKKSGGDKKVTPPAPGTPASKVPATPTGKKIS